MSIYVTETMQTFVFCIALLVATYAAAATTVTTEGVASTHSSSSTQVSADVTSVTTPGPASDSTTPTIELSGTTKQESVSTTSTEAAETPSKSPATDFTSPSISTETGGSSVRTLTPADSTMPKTENDGNKTPEGVPTVVAAASETPTESPTSDVTGSTATAEDATSTTTTYVTTTTTTTTASTRQPPFVSTAPTFVTTTVGENVTTTSTTTTSIASTTTTASRTTVPPGSIDLTNTFFDMILPLMFNTTFPPHLNDSSSDTFFEYSNEIRRKINSAFAECPGFDSRMTRVFEFIEGSIIANYSTSYKAEFVLLTPDSNAAITNFILNETFQRLENASFQFNLTVDKWYLNSTARAEVLRYDATFAEYRSEPCSHVPKCSPCYKCSNATTLQCVADCSLPSQTCYVTSDLTTGNVVVEECGCSVNYLLFAGTCVHQNLIIGVFAGVGGALVVSFLIAFIVCCHYRKKSGKKDSKRNSSGSMMRLDSGFDRNFHATSSNDSSEEDNCVAQQTATTRKVDTTDYTSEIKLGAEHSAFPPVDYLPEEVRQSTEYQNFRPHLENIDSHTEVKIKRPTLYEQVPND